MQPVNSGIPQSRTTLIHSTCNGFRSAVALDVYKDWLGIPEGPRPPDHYALLRLVRFEDDVEKIRRNYKKLNAHVRKYATGQYSQQSQDLLNELAKAMLCLTDVEWKKEYDQSLGRVIDDRDVETGRRPLTAFLQDEGILTQGQVAEVKAFCEKTGLSPRDAVVQMKFATQEQATRALAQEFGRPFLDLGEIIPDDAVLDQVPRNVVRRHTCLPLFVNDGAVLVACCDEPSQELEDEIRLRFGAPLRSIFATPQAINEGIAKYYAPGLRKEAAEPAARPTSGGGKSKPKAERVLTTAEKEEQKNLGIILIAWTIILLGNFDTWVMWDRVYKFYLPAFLSWTPFVLTFLVGGPICWLVYLKFIKPTRQ
jgi:hypothetical protein